MKRLARRSIIASRSMFGLLCTWLRKPSSASSLPKLMPDFASRSEATTSWVLLPIEDTIPMPVTATRLMKILLLDWAGRRLSGGGGEITRALGVVGEQAHFQVLR